MTAIDTYLLDVLDVFGPNAADRVAARIDADPSDIAEALRIVAGYVVDREQERLDLDPDMWHGITTETAHEIRASVIRDVAYALLDAANARRDAAYDAANDEDDWTLSRRFARSLMRGSRVL